MPCNKCNKEQCKCKRPKDICYDEGCEIKVPSECVIYRPTGGTSFISCYLGLNTKTNLQEILETLDYKLCNAFTLNLNSCIVDLLNLNSSQVDYKIFLNKLSDYICNNSDKYVRVSPTDTHSGYLNDKVQVSNCLRKRTIIGSDNSEKLEIYIDYACLQAELQLSSCIEVDCCGGGGSSPNNPNFRIAANTTTVCGVNSATLTASSSNPCTTILWFRNNVLLTETSDTTFLINQTGDYYALCKNAQGIVTSVSNTIHLNNTGTCGCVESIWNDTGESRCIGGNSEKEQVSNCGSFRWIPGGNGCTCVPVWVDKKPLEVYCGGYLNSLLGVSTYDNCIRYQLYVNQCNDAVMWTPYPKNPDGSACIECSQSCVPSGIFTSEVNGSNIIFKNSCDIEVGRFTVGTPERTCSGTGEERITIGVIPSGLVNPSDYIINYSIAGSTTRPSQSSNTFNDVNLGIHTTSVSIQRLGQSSTLKSVSGNIDVTACPEECTDPLATISITSNKSEICANESTSLTLNASKNGCTTVTWIRKDTPVSAEVQIGSGDSLTISNAPGGIYSARCSNCAGTAFSNNLAIPRSEDCSEPCTPNWIDVGVEFCIGDDLYIKQEEYCGLEATGEERNRLVTAGAAICNDDILFYRLVNCNGGGYAYTTDDLSSISSGIILTKDSDKYQYDGHSFEAPSSPTAHITGLTITSDTTCTTAPEAVTYSGLLHCDNNVTSYYTSTNLHGEPTGRIVTQGGHSYRYVGFESDFVTPPVNNLGTVTITELTTCPEVCIDPDPVISISGTSSTVCAENPVTLTAVGNSCNQINWYKAEFNTPTAWAFFEMDGGNTTEATTPGRYKAQCVNCKGSSDSNIVELQDGAWNNTGDAFCDGLEEKQNQTNSCSGATRTIVVGSCDPDPSYTIYKLTNCIPGGDDLWTTQDVTTPSNQRFEHTEYSYTYSGDSQVVEELPSSNFTNSVTVVSGKTDCPTDMIWRQYAGKGEDLYPGYFTNDVVFSDFREFNISSEGLEILYTHDGTSTVNGRVCAHSDPGGVVESIPPIFNNTSPVTISFLKTAGHDYSSGSSVTFTLRDRDWSSGLPNGGVLGSFTIELATSEDYPGTWSEPNKWQVDWGFISTV